MIQLSGERQVAVAPDRLYPEMADLTRLVHTLRDVRTVKSVSEDQATGCLVGMMGRFSVKGVVAGLAHWPPL